MKRLLSFALLLSLSLALFAACGPAKVPAAPISTEDSTTEQPDGTETAPDPATVPDPSDIPDPATVPDPQYHFVYKFYLGEGVRAISGIVYDVPPQKDFTLVIPDTVDGLPVVAIADDVVLPPYPVWIAKTRFEEKILAPLQKAVDDGRFSDLEWLKTYYTLLDLETTVADADRAAALERYPILATTPIYVFDGGASDSERNTVAKWILGYTDYSCADLEEDYRQTGCPTYGGVFASHVTSVRFPETLAVFPDGLLRNLTELETVELPACAGEAPAGMGAYLDLLLERNTGVYRQEYEKLRDFYRSHEGSGLCGSAESLQTLADGLFACHKRLRSVTLPQTLKKIGRSFGSCSALKEITVPAGVEGFDGIAAYAFTNCTALETVVAEGTPRLHDNLFENCGSLREIRWGGTIAEWGERSAAARIAQYLPNVRVVCTDGTVPPST